MSHIGSSVGISVVNALLTRNTQVNHADIAQHVTAVNRVFESPAVTILESPDRGQPQMISYVDDYKIPTLVVIPLLMFKRAPASGGENHALVMEYDRVPIANDRNGCLELNKRDTLRI
jgi:DHA2 family multidrug resistance protein